VEFRHPSWKTEGPWEMLRHYNIATVLTDSPTRENLTADDSFIRFQGRNEKRHYWFSDELKPWLSQEDKNAMQRAESYLSKMQI